MRVKYRKLNTEAELNSTQFSDDTIYFIEETKRTYCDMRGGGSHTFKW